MKVTVEKVDDINFIMSGTVDNSVIEEKVAKLKKEAAKVEKKDESSEENIEQDAAGQVFQDFINAGIKEANLDVANMVLKWNYDEERFEAYEVDLTAETAICYFDETWITV